MMHKWKLVLAALFAGALLPSQGTDASIRISSFSFFSDEIRAPLLSIDFSAASFPSANSQLSVSDPQIAVLAPSTSAVPSSPAFDPAQVELSIKPSECLDAYPEFAVGNNLLSAFRRSSDPILHTAPPSSRTAEQWNFVQHVVVGPGFWDAVGNMFDVRDDERPWSDTTSVHVLAPTGNPFVPFATIAYEVDSIEVYDRIGLGGGAQISLNKNTTIGADLIYFGDRLNDTMSHETRAMARLEIQF